MVGRVLERHLHAKCLPPILGPGLPVSTSSRQRPRATLCFPPVRGPCRPRQRAREGRVRRLWVTTSPVLLASHCWIVRRGLTSAVDKPTRATWRRHHCILPPLPQVLTRFCRVVPELSFQWQRVLCRLSATAARGCRAPGRQGCCTRSGVGAVFAQLSLVSPH